MNRIAIAALWAGLVLVSANPCALAASPASRATAQAASPLYGVEIIIFRASSPGADEDWNAPIPGRGFGGTANRGGTVPTVTRILPPSEYHMNSLESSLRASGAWRPIAHAAWIQTAANWGTHTGFALSDLGINVPGLTGSVYLERAPIYIHLGFDVQYEAGANYTIKEMRSVKYNDKQYFDHPAFGIIGMVTPIKRTETSTESRAESR
jgi:hypothetical protein